MPVTPDIPDTEAAIISMTNEFRLQNKLAPIFHHVLHKFHVETSKDS